MVDKIIFKGYKSFKNLTELELKPITVVFGKNSSGKSAVAKLPTLIEESLLGKSIEPVRYTNKSIELGAEYRDLFYQRGIQEQMTVELYSNSNFLKVNITNSVFKPIITSWEISPSILQEQNKFSSDQIEKEGSNIFSGFLLNKKSDKIKKEFNLKTDYIGPFRLNPPRVFHLFGNTEFESLGIKGKKAYEALVEDEDLTKKVSKWYEENFDGWQLNVNRVNPYYEIRIKQKDTDIDGVNIADVGQGMSQALPIIVKAHIKLKDPQLIILEQPELHLHPAAHGNLAELLFDSTNETNMKKFLIETHSKNFILRLRRLIAEGKMDKDSLNLYWVDYDNLEFTSTLKKINVNEFGEVDFWPEDIFNESFEETIALKKAQKDRV